MKKLILSIVLLSQTLVLFSQSEQEVKESIRDDVWIPFMQSYLELNPEKLKSIHSQDILRITISDNRIESGREYLENFGNFLNQVKERGSRVAIAFNVQTTAVKGDTAYQTGVYQFSSSRKQQPMTVRGYGNFQVVLRREEGVWKLVVDSDRQVRMTNEEFHASGTIYQLEKAVPASFSYQTFESPAGTLPYRMMVPENFNLRGEEKLPVLIFLHGSGERGDDNERQLINGAGELLMAAEVRHRALTIAPQCPSTSYWSSTQHRSTKNGSAFDYDKSKEPTAAMQMLLELVDSLAALPYVDPDRFYVMGLSMGGMGTFELVYRRPDLFKAAVPICGGGDPTSAGQMTGTRFWVFHGDQDNVVPLQYSEIMVDALRDAGASVEFTVYPGVNHFSWVPAFAEPELMNWIFQE